MTMQNRTKRGTMRIRNWVFVTALRSVADVRRPVSLRSAGYLPLRSASLPPVGGLSPCSRLGTWVFTLFLGIWVFGSLGICEAAELIPETAFTPLHAELAALATSRESSSSKRRACKGVIRDAQALIKAQPESPNRFRALALILKAQQRLLGLENNERNRDAFFETCEALTQAPDEYSTYRLNAELMLSERDLSARDADANERMKVLATMVERYRDTPGELECLMAAVRIATQLGSYELKEQLVKALSERFSGNATAIAFRRSLIGATRMDIVFSGTFERLDGSSMSFPFDRLGHPYFAVFWSKESAEALDRLKQLKEQQQQYPNAIEIYSFNVDELADGGEAVLKSIGLKCTVLRLPGGRHSQTYSTYAQHDPAALRVNQFGHAIVPPSQSVHFKNQEEAKEFAHSTVYDEFAYPITHGRIIGVERYDRYISQIQSLLIGDVLVTDATAPDVVGEGTVDAIRACFLRPPHRFRLSEAEALASYKKANDLCLKALAAKPEQADLWRVRNFRIVALMGMASLSGSSGFFQDAVKEATATAALALPAEAGVVAHFCLAKEALRDGLESAKDVLDRFIAQCGGDKANFKALSAAAILAIHADSPDLYHQYRARILDLPEPPQEFASFVSFLRDRFHQFYIFKGSPGFYLYSRVYRFAERRFMVNDGLIHSTQALPAMQLKTLDGKTVSLPDAKSDRLTLLLFVEPSASGGNDLTSAIYTPAVEPTKRNANPRPSGLLGSAYALAADNVNNGLQCITVFLSDDVARVKAIRDKLSLPGLVTVLPGGLDNPVVNQLGILSADRNANSFLIRRDGSIAWSKNGIPYQMSGKLDYISTIGLNVHINVCDSEAGYRALKAKDYKKALHLFTGTYLQKEAAGDATLTAALLQARNESDSKWKSTRLHGRALANVGLMDYETALADVDNAIAWHLRRNQFNHNPESPCSTMLHLLTTRSKILDGLGRSSEAREARNQAAVEPTDYPTYFTRIRGFNEPCEAFENRMSIVAKEIK